jgi:RNA recognition motif-containing protein
MSWSQVYVTGLPRSLLPTDEEIEATLDSRYGLSSSSSSSTDDDGSPTTVMGWAGRGTTIIKRDDSGRCRGFAFLSFHSIEAASVAIERINNGDNDDDDDDDDDDDGGGGTPRPKLRAEMSAALSKERRKKSSKNDGDFLPDLRLRRQRKKPVRKHPVIVSSDGRKTNLGNKTK